MPVSFQQKMNFSNRKEESVAEYSFVGGLITDAHESKLQPNQTPNVSNVIYNQTGSIKTRNGYTLYNADVVGTASDQANTGASTGSSNVTTTATFVAQTFVPSGAINATQVNLYLAMVNSGEEQYVRCELWSTTAGVPTTLLTNGQGPILLISGTSETAYKFIFKHPVALSAATTYAIVVKPFVRGSTQTVNDVEVHYTGTAYANGNLYTSSDTGENWTSDTNKDMKFVVYSGGDVANTGLIRYYKPSSTAQLLAKFGSTIYRGTDNTGAMTAITLPTGVAFNSANQLDYISVNDTLLVIDSDSQIKKYRGSTNANYSTGTISVTVDSATVTGSGTSWNTSTNAEVGEYIQLPDSKWYRITAIGGATSLTVETAYKGSTASGQTYAISPWGEVMGKLSTTGGVTVPTPQAIAAFQNRVWTLTNNQINFSVLDTSVTEDHFNDFDTTNNSGVINVPAGKGDTGTGLYALGNALFVFQRRAIWAIYGNSPANFELRNITNEIGMINNRTLVEWDDVLIFQSDRGIYMFDGTNLKNISDKAVNTTISSWASTTSPAATLWENKYLISYTPGGDAHNAEALFYDLTGGVWGHMDHLHMNSFSNWIGGDDHGEIYFGSSATGNIYLWDTGGNDAGYEIDTLYDTPSLSFDSGINDKAIKKFYIQQLALGDWDMTVTQLQNISENTTTGSDINLSPGSSSLWDVAQWDVDSWSSDGALITSRVAEFQGIGKYFKFRIEQSGYDEGIEVLAIQATARMRRLT